MRLTLIGFLLLVFSGAFAQQVTISGKITDQSGNPIPFASVYIQNTTQGSSANSEGEYSLQLKTGRYTIQYKAVGYKQESRTINANANQTLNITLGTEVY